ncbi:sugar-binding protein, partial [Chitinimonas sp.]|uniref:sugar-binding protein n=1 Tax=Chitinimonas sp. TaxID=1934313 RepID=UPI0035ADCDBF
MIKPVFLALAMSGSLATLAANIQAYRLPAGSTITIDGKLDDAVWAQVPRFDDFYEFTPRDKRAASQPTSMRVAYDANYLYVGVHSVDPEPSEVL